MLHLVQDLGIGHSRIWNAAKCDQFCQQNTKTPNIRFYGESRIICSLGSCPLDGEPRTHSGLVLVLLDQPRQAKVGYLDIVVITNQTIPARRLRIFIFVKKVLAHQIIK